MNFTAVYVKVPEGYIGFVEELPGANTQGETLNEARENLQEAVELVLDANRTLAKETLRGHEASRETMTLPAAGSGSISFVTWKYRAVNSSGKGKKHTVYVNRTTRRSFGRASSPRDQ
jgi:predicted RNase H-like HicB family nuclease